MKDLLQTSDGDLDLRQMKIVEGAEAVRQRIIQRFKMRKKSFSPDIEAGLDHEFIFGQSTDPVQTESWLLNYLAETPGVVKIIKADIEADPRKRSLLFSFVVLTESGEITEVRTDVN